MEEPAGKPSRGAFVHALKTIGWAFFGVRGKRGHDADLARLKPVHVIVVGLLMAAVFVLTLVLLAKWAVS